MTLSWFPQSWQERLWNRARHTTRPQDFDWTTERMKESKEAWEAERRKKLAEKVTMYGEKAVPERARMTGGDAMSIALFASAIPQCIFAPIDRSTRVLRAAYQVDHSVSGLIRNFFRLIQEEGPSVIFRGHASYLRHSIPINALPLFYQTLFFQWANMNEAQDGFGKVGTLHFFVGGLAGAVTSFSTYSVERVHWRLAEDQRMKKLNHKHEPEFKSRSFVRAYWQVLSRNGITEGLFEGFVYGLAGVTFHRAVMFGLYRNMQMWYQDALVPPDLAPSQYEMMMREPHSVGTFVRNWGFASIAATFAHTCVAMQAPWLASEGLRMHVGSIIAPGYGTRIGGAIMWPLVVLQGLNTGLSLSIFDTCCHSYLWAVEQGRA